jgi:hypothetical protein
MVQVWVREEKITIVEDLAYSDESRKKKLQGEETERVYQKEHETYFMIP